MFNIKWRLNTFPCLCEYQTHIWYTCRQSTPPQIQTNKQTNKCIYRRNIARLQFQVPSSQLAPSFNMAQFLKQPHHFKQHYQLKKNYSNSCACWEQFIFEPKRKLNFLLLCLLLCGWKEKKVSSIVLSFAWEVIEYVWGIHFLRGIELTCLEAWDLSCLLHDLAQMWNNSRAFGNW